VSVGTTAATSIRKFKATRRTELRSAGAEACTLLSDDTEVVLPFDRTKAMDLATIATPSFLGLAMIGKSVIYSD
jgi:hypothetical protein